MTKVYYLKLNEDVERFDSFDSMIVRLVQVLQEKDSFLSSPSVDGFQVNCELKCDKQYQEGDIF